MPCICIDGIDPECKSSYHINFSSERKKSPSSFNIVSFFKCRKKHKIAPITNSK